MGAPALRTAGVALGGRALLPRALAAVGAALPALLVLIVAPLALLSAPDGDSTRITHGAGGGIPAGLVAVFNEAARVYQVNAYLLAAIADQESGFGTGPGWRAINRAGCIG